MDATELPPSAFRVLEQLENGPLTNKDLVERTGFARRSLTRILQKLTEANAVTRRPSLRDTRRFYYSLDETGQNLLGSSKNNSAA